MRVAPVLVGACALASIAGAVSGTSINTTPIQRGAIGSAEIHRPSYSSVPMQSTYGRAAQAEHYDMTTPEGVIEVAELANRGLYSQDRYAVREAAFAPPVEPAFGEPAYLPDPVEDVTSPEALPADVIEVDAGPKIIDVSEALAQQT